MISVIICSAKKAALDSVTENIAATIGTAHEVIAINNPDGAFGICKAYNDGAARAKYDILCFMHEDVAFETMDWGLRAAAHLKNMQVGLIGVAGGDTKSIVPSGWPSLTFSSEINMVQHYKFIKKEAHKVFETGYPVDKTALKKVCCADGMWLCTRKDVFEKYKFDEKNFTGFHGYDIDYSLQVNQSYTVAVAFDIVLHHFSEGALNAEWVKSTIQISEKWRSRLPFTVRDMPKSELIRQHWTVMNVFIDKMIELNYTLPTRLKLLFSYSFNKCFHFMNFMHSLRLALGVNYKFYKVNKATNI